jgi:phospholipase C
MSAQTPIACANIKTELDNLNDQISSLEDELKDTPKQGHQKIIKQINALKVQLRETEKSLNTCILHNTFPPFGPPPQATKPIISTDTSPVTKTKVIPLSFLQKKFDDFFNKRTDPPIFKLRLHHHDHITADHEVDNDPPNSDFEFLFLDAQQIVTGHNGGYRSINFTDLGQLDHDYYFNEINSSAFNVNIDTSNPAPLELKITFETDGPTDMPCTGTLPDMKFKEFYISVRFTLSLDATAQPQRVDLLGWVNDLDNIQTDATNPFFVHVSGRYLGKAIDQAVPAGGYDDFFDVTFIQPVVHVHLVTTDATDPGGATQKSMRRKIFEKLVDAHPAPGKKRVRDNINLTVAQWLLGGDGHFPVTFFQNDGQNITLSYTVPNNLLNPFPFFPENWPAANKPPTNNPKLDFSPGALANIDHIIVLTKENRSFDHMLGFLSLPANHGGLGRKDVDGLKGGEWNPYNGGNYPSYPFNPGETLFQPNANQNAAPSFHQVDDRKMDGFVRSYAEEAPNPAEGADTGNGSTVMGYHNGANVPVYDALARDFAISHRWFAAHPGPTFPNRFYELTGRLNLNSGLADPNQRGFWEIDNTSPLTPSLSKTIFDHLNDYQHIANVSWNYFEHFYCFLRFFADYTFDHANVLDANDPVNGFFAKLKNGNLPSVSFIDPHFIDLPPHANCDEPPSDIKDGQDFVRRVVEAVVASPKWNKILLIITYDEHGGFYDHVPPPPLTAFTDDHMNYNLPVKTYGLRTPVFFVSPWVGAGQVFGHDKLQDSEELFFDNTSILKTIAKRFMSDFPPYLGPHYAAANDLSVVMGNALRQPQFLPFIRYNFLDGALQKVLDVQGGVAAPGTILVPSDKKDGAVEQDFSFEDAGDGFVYIRTLCGNFYVTVDVPPLVVMGAGAAADSSHFAIKQDVKYKPGPIETVNNRLPGYQKWKLTSASISILKRDFFVITNAFFTNKVLKCLDANTLVLGDPDSSTSPLMKKNAWKVTSPLVSHEIVVK